MGRICSPKRVIGLRPFLGMGNEQCARGHSGQVFYAECEMMLDQNAAKLLMVPSDERWVAFVNSIPNANIFHHPAWIGLMAECYGYRPFVVALCDEKGEITAGLPLMEVNSWLTGRRWVSLPFTDHCHPLSSDN